LKGKTGSRRSRFPARFRFCVSVFGLTLNELENKARIARLSRPDLIELRMDYLHNIGGLDFSKARKLLHGNEILTLRSRSEGGKFKGSESERVKLFKEAILPLSPKYVDIEAATLQRYPEILDGVRRGTRLIFSIHDLKGSRSFSELRKMIEKIPMKDRRIFAVKIVRKAMSFDDNFRILELYNSPKIKTNLIAFCTGPLGVFSRVMCLFMGSPYTYASLPNEPLASGQMDIETMREAVQLARKGIG